MQYLINKFFPSTVTSLVTAGGSDVDGENFLVLYILFACVQRRIGSTDLFSSAFAEGGGGGRIFRVLWSLPEFGWEFGSSLFLSTGFAELLLSTPDILFL